MDEIRSAEVSPSPLWAKPGNVSPKFVATPTPPPTPTPTLERTFKVILAGDASVGKSTFIERVCHGHFAPNLSSTIGN